MKKGISQWDINLILECFLEICLIWVKNNKHFELISEKCTGKSNQFSLNVLNADKRYSDFNLTAILNDIKTSCRWLDGTMRFLIQSVYSRKEVIESKKCRLKWECNYIFLKYKVTSSKKSSQ